MTAKTSPDTIKKAREFARTIAKAVAAGHIPPGEPCNGRHSAFTVAARSLSLSRGQRDHLRTVMEQRGMDKLWQKQADAWRAARDAAQPEPSPIPDPAKAATEQALRDEVTRLRGELKAALRENASEDAVLEVLGRMARHEVRPPAWLDAPPSKKGKATAEVPVLLVGDWHFGEVVRPEEINHVNAFNTEIARARVERLVGNAIDLSDNHMGGNYPGIVAVLLGDFISGGLHPELAKTDEEGRLEAALSVLDLMAGMLTRLADRFGNVFCPCVPGNHGRNTAKPEFKEYHKGNFDWLVYQLLARHFEARGDTRVKFLIPSSGDAFFRVFGLRIMATHGDMMGVRGGDGIIGAIGPIMRGEIKMRGQQASVGREYDLLVMGHWHQMLWLPRAVVNNALKGFDEYAAKSLRAVPSAPSQALFFVHPRRGVTARWEVALETPQDKAPAPWVAWPDGAEVRP